MDQKSLIMEYYSSRPNQDVPHAEAVDWATDEWKKRTGNSFRDPDRAIRKLHQEGTLIKVGKGVYKYDPDAVINNKLEDFTAAQKSQILERDGHKCAICGQGEAEGVELQVDHIRPKERGGKAELENGQALCSVHNFRKKTYTQAETGKRMFINLLRVAKKSNDQTLIDFCNDVIKVYDQHDINGHIKW